MDKISEATSTNVGVSKIPKKKWKTFKRFKDMRQPDPIPTLYENNKGKKRFFSLKPKISNQKEMFKIRVDYDSEDVTKSKIYLRLITERKEEEYIFDAIMFCNKFDHWKPKGFDIKIAAENQGGYPQETLDYIKSKASLFEGTVRKYLVKDRVITVEEKHKNLLGCILRNAYGKYYSASTFHRNEAQKQTQSNKEESCGQSSNPFSKLLLKEPSLQSV